MAARATLLPVDGPHGFPVEGTTGEPECGLPCLPGEAQDAHCAAAYAADDGERDAAPDTVRP